MENPFLSFEDEIYILKRKNKKLLKWLIFICFICFVSNFINLVLWILI